MMIATPDHMHAPITLAALRAGKHVYVEKPMAHSIEEARVMTRVARETGLVTQMGNNGHAGDGLRLTREWLQAGAIGPVREIHCWSDRPGKWWDQNHDRPDRDAARARQRSTGTSGSAPRRCGRTRTVYHPTAWRGWFDFGTGALGDMAIHNMDPAFYALDLGAPAAVEAKTSDLKPESYPLWTILRYEFAAKGDRPAVTLTWYDGGKMPREAARPPRGAHARRQRHLSSSATRGRSSAAAGRARRRFIPRAAARNSRPPKPTIPRSIGHRPEWIKACKDHKPEDAKAGFAYSGPFTEALLVGNLALRLQKRIEWDAADMKAPNAPEADD